MQGRIVHHPHEIPVAFRVTTVVAHGYNHGLLGDFVNTS